MSPVRAGTKGTKPTPGPAAPVLRQRAERAGAVSREHWAQNPHLAQLDLSPCWLWPGARLGPGFGEYILLFSSPCFSSWMLQALLPSSTLTLLYAAATSRGRGGCRGCEELVSLDFLPFAFLSRWEGTVSC